MINPKSERRDEFSQETIDTLNEHGGSVEPIEPLKPVIGGFMAHLDLKMCSREDGQLWRPLLCCTHHYIRVVKIKEPNDATVSIQTMDWLECHGVFCRFWKRRGQHQWQPIEGTFRAPKLENEEYIGDFNANFKVNMFPHKTDIELDLLTG